MKMRLLSCRAVCFLALSLLCVAVLSGGSASVDARMMAVPAEPAVEQPVEAVVAEGEGEADAEVAPEAVTETAPDSGVETEPKEAEDAADSAPRSGDQALKNFAEKTKQDAAKLYDAMDVLGYMEFDQKGRACTDEAQEVLCLKIQSHFLEILANEDFKKDCRARAEDMLINRLDAHTMAYGVAYHEAVDHKRVKAIVEAPDYKREDLKAYMDGAFQEVYQKGFDPAETETRQKVQTIRKDVMALCAQIIGQYVGMSSDNNDESKEQAEQPVDAPEAPPATEESGE